MKGLTIKRLLVAMGSSVALAGCISDSESTDGVQVQDPGNGGGIVIVVPGDDEGTGTQPPGNSGGGDLDLDVGEPVEQLQVYTSAVMGGGSIQTCTASGANIQVHNADGELVQTLRTDINGVVSLADIAPENYLTLTATSSVSTGARQTQAISIQRGLIDDSYRVSLPVFAGGKTNCEEDDGAGYEMPPVFTLIADDADEVDVVSVRPLLDVYMGLHGRFDLEANAPARDLLVMGYNYDDFGDQILERYSYERGVQGVEGGEVRVSMDSQPESLVKPAESDLVRMESFWLHPETWYSHSIEALSADNAATATGVKTVNKGEGALQVRRQFESGNATMLSVENYPNFGFPVPQVTEEVGVILSPMLLGRTVYFDLVMPGQPIYEMSYERRNAGTLMDDGNDPISHKVYTKDVDGEFTFPDLGEELESTTFERLDMTLATGPNEDQALWLKSRYTSLITLRPTDEAINRYLGDGVTTVAEAQRKIYEGFEANRVLHSWTGPSAR
ncbi:hypothetical protein [Marinobacter alkaliphilus]|uniref:Lipoprotein n=1 Tax=Marinobacter alkaliphilus TaxID=254719 RepID=A0ABZ3E9D8_9GAMM